MVCIQFLFHCITLCNTSQCNSQALPKLFHLRNLWDEKNPQTFHLSLSCGLVGPWMHLLWREIIVCVVVWNFSTSLRRQHKPFFHLIGRDTTLWYVVCIFASDFKLKARTLITSFLNYLRKSVSCEARKNHTVKHELPLFVYALLCVIFLYQE